MKDDLILMIGIAVLGFLIYRQQDQQTIYNKTGSKTVTSGGNDVCPVCSR
jgi:hypothetical protein